MCAWLQSLGSHRPSPRWQLPVAIMFIAHLRSWPSNIENKMRYNVYSSMYLSNVYSGRELHVALPAYRCQQSGRAWSCFQGTCWSPRGMCRMEEPPMPPPCDTNTAEAIDPVRVSQSTETHALGTLHDHGPKRQCKTTARKE